MTRNRPWTDEEERRLLEMRSVGRSIISVALALKRSTATVQLRLTGLRRREREAAGAPQGLKSMTTFNPSEPAILHNRLTDKIETWTGEDAADYRKSAVSNLMAPLNGEGSYSTAGATSSVDEHDKPK